MLQAPKWRQAMTTLRGPLEGIRIIEFDAIGPLPLAGMLLASEAHVRMVRSRRAGCAKVVHSLPCIFCGGVPR